MPEPNVLLLFASCVRYLLSKTLDVAAISYFEETPYSDWTFLGFLTAVKTFWSTSNLSDDLASTLKKRYTLILKDIAKNEAEVEERRDMANSLLKQVRSILLF